MKAALQFAVASSVCARCHGPMETTFDALRRPRHRCPKCDGVARNIRVHPDEVLVPVSLTQLSATALPPLEPGQLRCQRCAKGLQGRARFCVDCLRQVHALAKRKPCPDCRTPFVPNRSNHARCSDCATKGREPKLRLCTGCNRLAPHRAGPKTVKSCEHCKRPHEPSGRVYAPKLCVECRSTFQPTGPRALFCEACR